MASYTLSLSCGCTVYVACRPATGVAHTRIIETRGSQCFNRRHERGTRLWLWELLPAESFADEGPESPVTSLW